MERKTKSNDYRENNTINSNLGHGTQKMKQLEMFQREKCGTEFMAKILNTTATGTKVFFDLDNNRLNLVTVDSPVLTV